MTEIGTATETATETVIGTATGTKNLAALKDGDDALPLQPHPMKGAVVALRSGENIF